MSDSFETVTSSTALAHVFVLYPTTSQDKLREKILGTDQAGRSSTPVREEQVGAAATTSAQRESPEGQEPEARPDR